MKKPDNKVNLRRISAAARLKAQLEGGVKTLKNKHGGGQTPLIEADKERMSAELKILNRRITIEL